MPFLICAVPVCPVRAEASHRSEQVSQLLFGELCELVEGTADFVRIRVAFDNYYGWCQKNQLEEVDGDKAVSKGGRFAGDWINRIMFDGKPMNIPFGSWLPEDGYIGKSRVEFTGNTIDPVKNTQTDYLVQSITSIFLNTPYLWGGRSVFGIDCSGFSQLVYKCMNIPLLRDASQQVTQGDEVGFLAEVKCGDLAFFDNSEGKIVHVGILLGADSIVHAAGKVRVDTIDNVGIINNNTRKRTHQLRAIKRMGNTGSLKLF